MRCDAMGTTRCEAMWCDNYYSRWRRSIRRDVYDQLFFPFMAARSWVWSQRLWEETPIWMVLYSTHVTGENWFALTVESCNKRLANIDITIALLFIYKCPKNSEQECTTLLTIFVTDYIYHIKQSIIVSSFFHFFQLADAIFFCGWRNKKCIMKMFDNRIRGETI